MTRSLRRSLCAALRLGLALACPAAAPAWAQIAQEESNEPGAALEPLPAPEAERPFERLLQVQVRATSDLIPNSRFSGFDADIYRPAGRLKLTLPLTPDFALRLVVRGQTTLYEFDSVNTDLFGTPSQGRPFHDLNAGSAELQWAWRTPWSGLFAEDETWSLVGEGYTRSDWEKGATFGNAVTGGAALGVGYQLGERLELIVGGSIGSALDGGLNLSPVYELDWRFADRWRFSLRGLRGEIEYELREGLAAFVMGRLEGRTYLLEDRGGIVGEGYLRDRIAPVGLGLRWDSAYVKLSVTVGAVVYHQLRSMDDDQNDIETVTARPAPFLEFAITPRLGRIFGATRTGARPAAGAQRVAGGSSSSSISTSR